MTNDCCIHGVSYQSCGQCGLVAEDDAAWRAVWAAEYKVAVLRDTLRDADARIAKLEDTVREMEATIARLWYAIEGHGQCSCRYTPGYPRGSRHAPDCDYDPDLLAAFAGEDKR